MNTIDLFRGEHRWLSNFWLVDIYHEGYIYPSVEHAYQACKCALVIQRPLFLHGTPGEAKRLSRQYQTREDWNEVKYNIMFELVYKKFDCTDYLREKLLATKDTKLVEGNTWGDTYWGVCKGKGDNNLGKILMEVRGMLL